MDMPIQNLVYGSAILWWWKVWGLILLFSTWTQGHMFPDSWLLLLSTPCASNLSLSRQFVFLLPLMAHSESSAFAFGGISSIHMILQCLRFLMCKHLLYHSFEKIFVIRLSHDLMQIHDVSYCSCHCNCILLYCLLMCSSIRFCDGLML